MKCYLAALAVVLSLFSSAASATAPQPIVLSQFNFSGICNDCNQNQSLPGFHKPVTAELFLNNYKLGDQISGQNFVSFHYDGSNLYHAFTIDKNNVNPYYLSGVMTTLSGFENFMVLSNTDFFTSSTFGGYWSLGSATTFFNNLDDDNGSNGTFTKAVPEPGSIALLGLGLLCFAASRRQPAK